MTTTTPTVTVSLAEVEQLKAAIEVLIDQRNEVYIDEDDDEDNAEAGAKIDKAEELLARWKLQLQPVEAQRGRRLPGHQPQPAPGLTGAEDAATVHSMQSNPNAMSDADALLGEARVMFDLRREGRARELQQIGAASHEVARVLREENRVLFEAVQELAGELDEANRKLREASAKVTWALLQNVNRLV